MEIVMTRLPALLLAATLVAVPLASHAKGGGHGCGGGHSGGGGGHSTHGGGGHSTTHFSSAPMGTYRAGYVREDGTYVEPERQVSECSPDRPCEPSRPSPRR
jgi:hypothetical protein